MALWAPVSATAQSLDMPYRPMPRVFVPVGPAASPVPGTPSATSLGTAGDPSAPALFTRTDVWFLAAAATGVAIVSSSDRGIRSRVTAMNRPDASRLASFVRPLGTPSVIGPGLLAGYFAGRIANAPALSEASARVFVAVGSAAAATLATKYAIGRARPMQAPGDPDEFRPFSGDASFPSGHTALAFATARALDRETDAEWVPWVAYSAASLVGWSRVEDNKHWASDVVGGAALGWFVADKAENLLRRRVAHGDRLTLLCKAKRNSYRIAARLRF